MSGDTTSGGLGRLDWSVPDGTQGVILELGANDALRGIDPKVPRAALTEILTRLKARNISVLLCGMLAPPNYGADYAEKFNSIYPDLARQFGVPLYPFFLEGVAGDSKLNQADAHASDCRRRRHRGEEYPAQRRGICRHDRWATQLRNRQSQP